MIREYITKKEDKVIRTYGFEHKRTLAIFKYTDFLRKIFKIKYWQNKKIML